MEIVYILTRKEINMENKKLMFAIVIAVVCCFCLTPKVSAASSTYSFSGEAGAFGGKYDKFVAENSQTSNYIKYIKLQVYAHDGNKLKIGFLHTEDWVSTAQEVVSTGTLKATGNNYTVYFIPSSMSCPDSNAICLTVPNQYSTSGNGNNIGYDFMAGFRFTNESWFFGTLYIQGSYTLYY